MERSLQWSACGQFGKSKGTVPWRLSHALHSLKMEPAIRIERTTCGLRISDNPISDNLTPQETTNQDAPDMGADGGD
jgi:hypothetical protein